MTVRRTFAALLAASFLVSMSSRDAAADDLWTTDFEQAKATAEKDGRDILMEFTGSDWCPPCIKLNETVLSQDLFKTEAPKHFVLLKLDSPRDKSKQSEEEQEQNARLGTEYGVTGLPSIVLADAMGRPYAMYTGYGSETAKDYVKKLVDATDIRKQRDEFLAQAEKASGAEKARLLDQAISRIEADLALSKYGDTVAAIIAADPKNEAGLKTKYEGLLTAVAARAELEQLRSSLDPDALEATLSKIDALIEKSQLEGEILQEALYLKGFIQFQADDLDVAKATIEAALKLAPESDTGRQIQRILNTVFKEDKAPEKAPDPDADEANETELKP